MRRETNRRHRLESSMGEIMAVYGRHRRMRKAAFAPGKEREPEAGEEGGRSAINKERREGDGEKGSSEEAANGRGISNYPAGEKEKGVAGSNATTKNTMSDTDVDGCEQPAAMAATRNGGLFQGYSELAEREQKPNTHFSDTRLTKDS
jgi:hypothetical protein